MDTIEDQKLIEYFLEKEDDLAFEKLLKRHLKSVYNFLYQFSGNAETIDDLTQETFIKAWKNIRRFNKNRNFKTWIFTIARNTAYDYFKKKKTIPFSNFIDEEGNNKLENIADNNILPDKILEKKDIAEYLEKKLEKIPEHYRIILTLRYKEDFSLQEISEILGESYNTIKSRHIRSLQSLKNVILSE